MDGSTKAVIDDVDRDHDRQSSARNDIRRKVDHKVGEAIDKETDLTGPGEQAEVESVAHELKARSVTELRQSGFDLDRGRRLKRIYQFTRYAFYVVYGVVGLMIGLELLGARDSSGFMQFMRLVTTPLLTPFRNVMPDPSVGSSQLMLSYILALVVYALVHLAVKGIFRILIHRDGAAV